MTRSAYRPVEDEVDRIVAAWRRERPDLDVTPLEVLSRITRLARHLDRVRSAVFATHGLEGWEFDALTALRRSGHPYQLPPNRLSSQPAGSGGTLTSRVERLEERGLVQRLPGDGNGVSVRLTPRGKALVDETLTDLLDRERELVASLDPVRRRELAGLLRRLVAPFDAEE